MPLASSCVITVEWAPQNGCCQCLHSQGGLSCLLPLQGSLQDLQVGVTQDPFKLLLLHWDSECVRRCACPFRADLSFLQPSCSPKHKPFWFSKPDVLGAHLPNAGLLGLGAHVGVKTIFGEKLYNLIFLLFVDHQPRLVGPDYIMSLLLLPFLCFHLYVFSCTKSFLLVFKSFSYIVAL